MGAPLDCQSEGPQAPQPQLQTFSGALSFLITQRGNVPRKLPKSMSEDDCLNLQLYVPDVPPEMRGKIPVLVFAHGGMFMYGSNAEIIFHDEKGCKLAAKQKIAVVFPNYRLGALGFAKVPGGETNLGVRDLIAALQWVQEQGPSLGLDTQNVTLGGQSAGAMLTGALLRAPSAQGLFHRVIMMSGGPQNATLSLRDAELLGERLAKLVDVWSASAAQVLSAANQMLGEAAGMMPFQPCIDGDLLTEELWASGLDILTGVTEDEARIFVPLPVGKSRAKAMQIFSDVLGEDQMNSGASDQDKADIVQQLQKDYNVSRANDIFRILLSGVVFEAPALQTARHLQDQNNVYFYRNAMGKMHGGEIPYVFGTWSKNVVLRVMSGLAPILTPGARRNGKAMELIWQDVVGSFVRVGKPPGPRFDAERLAASISPAGVGVMLAATPTMQLLSETLSRRTRPWGVIMEPDVCTTPRSRL